MAKNFSPIQIAGYAYQAGFRGNDLIMSVAVALAESGGDPNAYNPEPGAGTPKGHGSRGLWQIYGWAHPSYDSDKYYDPQLNAQAAYAIYKGAKNKFTDWSTFNNGAAKALYNTIANQLKNFKGGGGGKDGKGPPPPDTGNPPPSTGGSGSGPSDTGTGNPIADAILKVLGVSKIDWASLAMIAAGAVLILIGIVIMLRSAGAKVAVQLIPVAKAAAEPAKTAVDIAGNAATSAAA